MTLRAILHFLIQYKYQAILPVAIAEGPIITIICGFLVSLGHLALLPTLLIVFFGDVISDSVFYFLGKGGRHVIKYLKFLHISEDRMAKIENQFAKSPWKTMILAKISYGLGSAFMVASGVAKMSPKDFFKYILSLDFIRSSIMLFFGFYFGKAALLLGPVALKYYTISVVVLVPTMYIVYHKKFRRTS